MSFSGRIHFFQCFVLFLVTVHFCAPTESKNAQRAPIVTKKLMEITDFGQNPGNLQMFLYEPSDMPRKRTALVVALHGCHGSAQQFSNAGFDELADKLKFLVVYPQQKKENHEINCFHTMVDNEEARQKDEARSVMHMVRYVRQRNLISSKKIFVTGFSSGGQFAYYLVARYPETFSAGVLIGAGGYRCREGHTGIQGYATCKAGKLQIAPGKKKTWPRMSIWHGDNDQNIPATRATEAENQWKQVHGIKKLTLKHNSGTFSIRSFQGERPLPLLEVRKFTDLAHEIPVVRGICGSPGGYFSEYSICYAKESVKFFGLTK